MSTAVGAARKPCDHGVRSKTQSAVQPVTASPKNSAHQSMNGLPAFAGGLAPDVAVQLVMVG